MGAASTQSKDLYSHTVVKGRDPSTPLPPASRTATPLRMTDRTLDWRHQLDFQVNGETYFVALGEREKEWLVFVDTPAGARRVPVYEDATEVGDVKVVVEDGRTREVVN